MVPEQTRLTRPKISLGALHFFAPGSLGTYTLVLRCPNRVPDQQNCDPSVDMTVPSRRFRRSGGRSGGPLAEHATGGGRTEQNQHNTNQQTNLITVDRQRQLAGGVGQP